MSGKNLDELYDILVTELRPALGCGGPTGACIVAAQAYKAIGGNIEKIHSTISLSMVARLDDVAMPGTSILGLEMATALGAVCGDADAGFEVLHNVTPEGELKARDLVKNVTIEVQKDAKTLARTIECEVYTDRGVGKAITQEGTNKLIYLARNGEVLFETEPDSKKAAGTNDVMLQFKIKDCYDLASTYPAEKFTKILKAIELNTAIANFVLQGPILKIGVPSIGYSLMNQDEPTKIIRAKALTAAGCEGRMSGTNLAVMSCGGKGNVGLAGSLPLVSLARDLGVCEEKTARAIALSYLLALSVIHRIGKAPTMCSCMVAASLGIAAGTVFLYDGTLEQIETAIQNVMPNVFGVVCDGAKLSCALRLSTAAGVAIECAKLAMDGVRTPNNQGILGQTADETIEILGKHASLNMFEADKAMQKIIVEKRKEGVMETLVDRYAR